MSSCAQKWVDLKAAAVSFAEFEQEYCLWLLLKASLSVRIKKESILRKHLHLKSADAFHFKVGFFHLGAKVVLQIMF